MVRRAVNDPSTKKGNGAPSPFRESSGALFGGNRARDHRHVRAPAPAGTEPDLAFDQREQRVIPADADIVAGVPAGAPLADDDVAGDDVLAAELLHAEPLARRVAAVARAAAGLLVRHLVSPRSFGLRLPRSRGCAAPSATGDGRACADSSCAASS